MGLGISPFCIFSCVTGSFGNLLRRESKIETLIPGLTGWAQINGRDNISIQEKVEFDKEYLSKVNVFGNKKLESPDPVPSPLANMGTEAD